MAISTNQKPTLYRNWYENTALFSHRGHSFGENAHLDEAILAQDPVMASRMNPSQRQDLLLSVADDIWHV